jgi:hypothetical protein
VQELLDALGAEQRAVQIPEVSGVGDVCSVLSRHGIRIRLVFGHLPRASAANVTEEPGLTVVHVATDVPFPAVVQPLQGRAVGEDDNGS